MARFAMNDESGQSASTAPPWEKASTHGTFASPVCKPAERLSNLCVLLASFCPPRIVLSPRIDAKQLNSIKPTAVFLAFCLLLSAFCFLLSAFCLPPSDFSRHLKEIMDVRVIAGPELFISAAKNHLALFEHNETSVDQTQVSLL